MMAFSFSLLRTPYRLLVIWAVLIGAVVLTPRDQVNVDRIVPCPFAHSINDYFECILSQANNIRVKARSR